MEINRPKTDSINGTVRIGTWSSKEIPVYTVFDADGLNQIVGYVKLINAVNGTVLYRGQCDLYPSVIPSICREKEKLDSAKAELANILNKMVDDDGVKTYWHFEDNQDISSWKDYRKMILEATLQHYGAKTFCVDFVDNHWTALWFGLYRWNQEKKMHERRKAENKNSNEDDLIVYDLSALPFRPEPAEPQYTTIETLPQSDINMAKKLSGSSDKPIEDFLNHFVKKHNRGEKASWEEACKKYRKDPVRKQYLEDDKKAHMYLFLYVADTNAPTLRGVSIGKETYVMDLRKTIPSTFLRPCSQHGWIVRGNKEEKYCFETNIACVLRISVELVDQMLGEGLLNSPKNFFPSPKRDEGYNLLLSRQEGTSTVHDDEYPIILPMGTIPAYE